MRWILLSIAIHIVVMSGALLLFGQKTVKEEITLNYQFKETLEREPAGRGTGEIRRLNNLLSRDTLLSGEEEIFILEQERKLIMPAHKNILLEQAEQHFSLPQTMQEKHFVYPVENSLHTGTAISPRTPTRNNVETIRHTSFATHPPEKTHVLSMSRQSDEESVLFLTHLPAVSTSSKTSIRCDPSLPHPGLLLKDVVPHTPSESPAIIRTAKHAYPEHAHKEALASLPIPADSISTKREETSILQKEKNLITVAQKNIPLQQAQHHFPFPQAIMETNFSDKTESSLYTKTAISPRAPSKEDLEHLRRASFIFPPEHAPASSTSGQDEQKNVFFATHLPAITTSTKTSIRCHSSIPYPGLPVEDVLPGTFSDNPVATNAIHNPYPANTYKGASGVRFAHFLPDTLCSSSPLFTKAQMLTQQSFGEAITNNSFPAKLSSLKENLFSPEQRIIHKPFSALTSPMKNQESSSSLTGYLKHIVAIIEQNKRYPSRARKEGMEGRVGIRFVITRAGKVQNFKLLAPSNFPELNEAAKILIDSLSPFPPLPEDVSREKITINMEVVYELQEAP
ncbi:energy transducer TonB [Candidatus Aerophobetes bacterium]|nr:energy transducer TonB [Candidatus Aerophobetes bacterium]